MKIDFKGLHKTMDEFSKEFIKVMDGLAETIGQVFSGAFNKSKDLIEDTVGAFEIIEYKEKVKFKPVLKIEPSKLYYEDKSVRNYYCRNNC